MISMMTKYYLFKQLMEKEEFNDQEIKDLDEMVREYKNSASNMFTILSRFPIPEDSADFSAKAKVFYEQFHKYKIKGFMRSNRGKSDKKPGGGSGDQSKNKPPQDSPPQGDFQGERRPSKPKRPQMQRYQRRQGYVDRKGHYEEALQNKLKPLIREMLNKGK